VSIQLENPIRNGGTAAAAPPPSGLATLPSVGAVP